MKEFRYRAVNRDDELESGILEAVDVADAGHRLVGRGLYPLDVSPSRSFQGILTTEIGSRRLSTVAVAQLFDDIGSLLNAGIEVAAALTLAKASGPIQTQRIVAVLLDHVRKGNSLSEAMQKEPRSFAPHIISIVEISETSNALGPSLTRAASNLRKTAVLRAQVRTALIYPSCIAVAVFGAILVLMLVVVPTLEGLFADHAAHLPWQTRLLISISGAIREHYLIGFCLLAIVCFIPTILWQSLQTRMAMEQFALRLPLIGGLLRSVETAQIAAMLAMLAFAGIPLVDAVGMTRYGARLAVSRDGLGRTVELLREGRRLHKALDHVISLNPRLLALVQIGETTGRLGPLLEEASVDAERHVATTTERALAILPPAMTLFFGAVAGFVLFAVMSAILSVNSIALRGG